jgi:hypothetical protein
MNDPPTFRACVKSLRKVALGRSRSGNTPHGSVGTRVWTNDAVNPNGIASHSPRLLYSATLGVRLVARTLKGFRRPCIPGLCNDATSSRLASGPTLTQGS